MNATQVAPKAYDMNKNPDTDNIRTGHRTVKANDLKKIGEQTHPTGTENAETNEEISYGYYGIDCGFGKIEAPTWSNKHCKNFSHIGDWNCVCGISVYPLCCLCNGSISAFNCCCLGPCQAFNDCYKHPEYGKTHTLCELGNHQEINEGASED